MKHYEYKGYLGSAEVDIDQGVLVGKLLFIRDSIAYSAKDPAGLQASFREAVDDYLRTCEEFGDTPDVPFKGTFNVRIDPALHRTVALKATSCGVSLNRFVEQSLYIACSEKVEHHNHTYMTVQVEHVATTGIATAAGSSQFSWEKAHGHRTH